MSAYRFSFAEREEDLAAIRCLNYQTFVVEIPQHAPNREASLTDRFDADNAYGVCHHEGELVGMIALRSQRPFSLDFKLPALDTYLPPHRSPCEIRLLAVKPTHRNRKVLPGLIGLAADFFSARGHDLALISGTTRQTRLYQRMGFTAFGPQVGSPEALYQPMYQFFDAFLQRGLPVGQPRQVNLLPGPTTLSPAVAAALATQPVSHRSLKFSHLLERTRRRLCKLAGAKDACIALGSGTLANDLVAGQIAQLPGRGAVLINGEFGHRLANHATRMGLGFDRIEIPWGSAFEEPTLRTELARLKLSWIWAVHAETSTGVLNDLGLLKQLAAEGSAALHLDCVSSLGLVPCDLDGVATASGVSGKGIRCVAGLAFVFHSSPLPEPRRPLPRYLDLRTYANGQVPYTLPSNLVNALLIALEELDSDRRCRETRDAAEWLCGELERAGLEPLAPKAARFPGAITIPLPPHASAHALGDALEREGWHLSYRSAYLAKRNWIQICLMSPLHRSDVAQLPARIHAMLEPISKSAPRR